MTSMIPCPVAPVESSSVSTPTKPTSAVAIDDLGAVLDSKVLRRGLFRVRPLIDWSLTLGGRLAFGIEGTGSYGAGLTSAVRRRDIGVIALVRTDRRDRRLRGKSDTLDAENAAKAVPAGTATAVPKAPTGSWR